MIKILNTQAYLVNEENINNLVESNEYADGDYFQYQIETTSGTKRMPAANSYEDLNLRDLDSTKKKSKKDVSSPAIFVTSDEQFKCESHFYPQVLKTQIHPLVARFFKMGNQRIMSRYKQMNPLVDLNALKKCLEYKPKHFKYAGCDLFKVTNKEGNRQMIIIETNSCPSGQKSMPLVSESEVFGGYKTIVESILDDLLVTDKQNGDLAVIYDKNLMESSAYCSVLAKLSKEKVWFVEYYDDDHSKNIEWRPDGYLYVRDQANQWHPIRACIRYVTQKPWNRIPLNSKTIIINPIIACLAGGRNKIMAAHAYERLNRELESSGLSIRIPTTKLNITKNEIPAYVQKMGGHAVIKEPYGNCGVGVYTITNQRELDEFMNMSHHYEKFIIQSLVGHASWSKPADETNNDYYHVCTLSNENNEIFAYDLRMVVTANRDGFLPVSINGRRARKPLVADLSSLDETTTSWDMLGTNLSIKLDHNVWDTESVRLLLMDNQSFDELGVSVDDLIDGYIQTVLSIIAIDKMCACLLDENNKFKYDLYRELNFDDALFEEIKI